MKSRPLEHITVLDLTHRLPGPLAGHLLSEMGAKVIKVEDDKFGDPFLDGFFKKMDPSFSHWYEALNKNKKIQRFSLKDDCEKLKKFIEKADLVLMGLPAKLQLSLGVNFECIKTTRDDGNPIVYIEMISSHTSTFGMHDLNALARNRLLDLYLYEVSHLDSESNPKRIAPPFLPMAGIGYGAMLANVATAALLKAYQEGQSLKEVISLEESVQSLLTPFYSQQLIETGQKTFLHNGRYPCYNIYPLKDEGHLAVACLEEKYWQKFCELIELDLLPEERFVFENEDIFEKIQKKLKTMTFKQVCILFNDQDCCVDPIGAIGA